MTPRDIALLQHLARNEFLTGAEIKTVFWQNTVGKTHLQRLKLLVQHRYLATITGDQGMRLGYCLGLAGKSYVEGLGMTETHVGDFARSYKTPFHHDMTLHKLRRIWEPSPLISAYRTERSLRKSLTQRQKLFGRKAMQLKVPDAAFQLQSPNGVIRVVVELELSRKSNVRYSEICQRLLTSLDWEVIFYVVSAEAMANLIRSHLNQVIDHDPRLKWNLRRNRFYFVRLDDVLNLGLDAPFQGNDGSFTLNLMAQT